MNDIKDALSRVADASAPSPLSLEHVRGRARQIRRRRTTAAILGSAAAVAAIAGLGVVVMPSGSNDDSLPPASHTPSADPSPSKAAETDALGPVLPDRLDVPAEQTFNDTPRVPIWHDGQIEDVDGSATPLADRPLAFAKDTKLDQWVVVREEEAHAQLVRLAADGTVVGQPVNTFADGLAVGPDGQVATITEQKDGWVLSVDEERLALGRTIEWAALEGFTTRQEVVVQMDGTVRLADAYKGTLTDVPGAAAAVPSQTLPLTAVGRDDGTWVAQREDGSTQWSLDWAGVSSFSPDGRYVALVGDPKHRIAGSADWDSDHATGTLWIRTAGDLLPVAAFTAPPDGYFWSWTWDGDQLLATVYSRDTGQWSLVRLSADGVTVGRATAKPGGGEEPAYVFPTQ
jgi:hypothetical protein